MADQRPRFIPALRFSFLTPLYDGLMRATLPERRIKWDLIQAAGLSNQQVIMDLGCGTGTLGIMAKQAYPNAEVLGLDGDANVLALARSKDQDVHFQKALSSELPFEDHRFDRVLSSFFFHHLVLADKLKTLRETYRVLLPNGEFHIADWGKPVNWMMRVAFLSVQLLDGFETTRDSVSGVLVDLLRETGFESVEETRRLNTVYGTLSFYRARKPESRYGD